jgi:transcriptional regulator with XRE-family HTH domain
MAEIGETLRDARMRARIDISEIEAQTKIRAKYLRAIENEEWDLLPGPTYVKSFLRTYAEALGLDARLLVEEYKARHERLSDDQLRPIGPPGSGSTSRGGRPRAPGGLAGQGGGPPRLLIVGVIVVLLLGALWVLGQQGNDDPEPRATTTAAETQTQPRTTAPPRTPTEPARTPPPSKLVRLRVVAKGQVYVCLVAGARVLVPGVVLAPGQSTETFRSRRFRVNLGNSDAQLVINGVTRSVPDSSEAIGYVITRQGRRTLPAGKRPDCT